MFMSNWAIARRLTLSFLLAALIAGAAAGLAGLTHAQALGTEAQLYRQILTANQYLDLADNNLLLMDPTLHNAIQDAESNLPDDLAIAKQSLQLMESQLNTALHHYGQKIYLPIGPMRGRCCQTQTRPISLLSKHSFSPAHNGPGNSIRPRKIRCWPTSPQAT